MALTEVELRKPEEIDHFIKVPFEILQTDSLTAADKLLWALLRNIAEFRPVSRQTLDKMLGCHRTTRQRSLDTLENMGFITITNNKIIIEDHRKVLLDIRNGEAKSTKIMMHPLEKLALENEQAKATPRPSSKQFSEILDAWNNNLPKGYQRLRKVNVQLLKAIDQHMLSLNLQPGQYDLFFSTLRIGVENSQFWSTTNSCKTLTSITGVGNPTQQKSQNVLNLYNSGEDLRERGVKPKHVDLVLSARYRHLIDDYREAEYKFVAERDSEKAIEFWSSRIRELEAKMKEARINPRDIRRYDVTLDGLTWPTATELGSQPFATIVYDDELGGN